MFAEWIRCDLEASIEPTDNSTSSTTSNRYFFDKSQSSNTKIAFFMEANVFRSMDSLGDGANGELTKFSVGSIDGPSLTVESSSFCSKCLILLSSCFNCRRAPRLTLENIESSPENIRWWELVAFFTTNDKIDEKAQEIYTLTREKELH